MVIFSIPTRYSALDITTMVECLPNQQKENWRKALGNSHELTQSHRTLYS